MTGDLQLLSLVGELVGPFVAPPPGGTLSFQAGQTQGKKLLVSCLELNEEMG